MKIRDRYASAINSSNLAQHDGSDADILGAYGLADAELTRRGQPLAVAIERLLLGDSAAARVIIDILADEAVQHMFPGKLTRTQARQMAVLTLAWFRNGRCDVCGGHGYSLIPGTKTLSASKCRECKGAGKWSLEARFHKSERETVRHLAAWMESQQAIAGVEAMKKLGPKLSFD